MDDNSIYSNKGYQRRLHKTNQNLVVVMQENSNVSQVYSSHLQCHMPSTVSSQTRVTLRNKIMHPFYPSLYSYLDQYHYLNMPTITFFILVLVHSQCRAEDQAVHLPLMAPFAPELPKLCRSQVTTLPMRHISQPPITTIMSHLSMATGKTLETRIMQHRLTCHCTVYPIREQWLPRCPATACKSNASIISYDNSIKQLMDLYILVSNMSSLYACLIKYLGYVLYSASLGVCLLVNQRTCSCHLCRRP